MPTVLGDTLTAPTLMTKKTHKKPESRRDASARRYVALPVLASPVLSLKPARLDAEPQLRLIEDRRTFGFLTDRPPRTLRTARPQLVVRAPARPSPDRFAKLRALSSLSPVVSFRQPGSLAMCIRRNTRKQVLHAFGLAGRKGSVYHPRRNAWSSVSCK